MKRIIVTCMVIMFSGAAAVHGGWTVVNSSDPTMMASDGLLVKASNLGKDAAVQTIAGIAYDVDYSNISGANAASNAWTSKFYSGSDPAISNLMNTGGKVSEWGPTTMTFAFSGLTVGHDYRFQLLMGGDYSGCDANLYGAGGEYKYVYFGVPKLATFTWTAGSESATIRSNAGKDHASHFNLAYALHDTSVPEPASLVLLGIGGLISLRRQGRRGGI